MNRTPRVEILAIGDELTSGARVDTNTAWLSEQLQPLGLSVRFHTTVGDQWAENLMAFQAAAERSDIVLVTGGLGPTADDLTRQVLAEVSGKALRRDTAVICHIEQLFQRYGRAMPDSNLVQADFPETSQVIPNPEGTAPGIDLRVDTSHGHCRFFCLPGVPAEMKGMFADYVVPQLQQMLGQTGVTLHHVIHCFGAGESQIESMLPDLIRRDRVPQVGITASGAVISLRIAARGATAAACRDQMQATIDLIHERLGTLVFGTDQETLDGVVRAQLHARRQRIAIWDFFLGGDVGGLLAPTTVGDPVLRGAIYVPPDSLSLCQKLWPMADPIQLPQVARQVRLQWEADIAVVIGPLHHDSDHRPAFSVIVTDGHRDQESTHYYTGHSSLVRTRATKQVLNAIRLFLMSAES